MERRKIIAGLLTILLFPMLSCQEDREIPETIASAYLPLSLGQSWTYEVVEKEYFGENDIEDRAFYSRDRITRQFFNEIGEKVHVVTRERSENLGVWENELAYTLTFSRNRIIRTINNEPLITLVYPIVVSQQWDGNGMSARNSELFTIEEIGQFVVGDRVFGTAAFVRHAEEDDLITLRDNRYEVYAEGIGMIASFYEVYTYCSRSDCLGEQIIQSGRFTQMKLVANGIL